MKEEIVATQAFPIFSLHFNVQQSSDDEDAHVMKGKFKDLNEKLDMILESTKSSSSFEYMLASHRALIETLTKEHDANLAKSIKVVEDYEKTCKEMTKKLKTTF